MIQARHNQVGFYILIFLISVSCDRNRVFEDTVDFPAKTWQYDSTVVFDFVIEDVSLDYNLYYQIRNTIDFPKTRLFVTYFMEDSVGQILEQKLVFENLFDAKTGQPFGKGFAGTHEHQFLIFNDYTFPYSGNYRMRLQQFMRDDVLEGIVSVGFRVEKSSGNKP